MRVLIVDDSAFMRCALARMLREDPAIEIVGSARTGREAVEMAQRLSPDVVTLDIEMPEMDGLTALQIIMRRCPTQVIMLSSLTVAGSHAALRALSLGAADVLAKEASCVSLGVTTLKDELLMRVRTLGRKRSRATSPRQSHEQPLVFQSRQFDVICIGSSTGGPPVLELILKQMPRELVAPIVVAQHMPGMFTQSMAQRLDQLCDARVCQAGDRQPLTAGTVYIAPGGRQTHIQRLGPSRCELVVNDKPADALYRPSVDVLFASAAKAFGPRMLGIVLTGMGCDGLHGAREIRTCGGVVLAQDEQSCVVYGMPKAVTENGLTVASLTPSEIARAILPLVRTAPQHHVNAVN